jgi:hypothetical protein
MEPVISAAERAAGVAEVLLKGFEVHGETYNGDFFFSAQLKRI